MDQRNRINKVTPNNVTVSNYLDYITMMGIPGGNDQFNFSVRPYLQLSSSYLIKLVNIAYSHYTEIEKDQKLKQFGIELLWHTIKEYMFSDTTNIKPEYLEKIEKVKREYERVTSKGKILNW